MMRATIGIALLLSGAVAHRPGNICCKFRTGFHQEDEHTMACYLGTFLEKMLVEVHEGAEKTAEHVRRHLLPWTGGREKIEATRGVIGDQRPGPCTVCFTNNATADSLGQLYTTVPEHTVAAYEALDVCYMQLTDWLMDHLTTNRDGSRVVPAHHQGRHHEGKTSAFEETVGILRRLFRQGGVRRFTHCQGQDVPPEPRLSNWTWLDVCDEKNHGLKDPVEAGVFCYVASFMTKMMWELATGDTKTEQHVRTHFTPYMGGELVSAAIKDDDTENATCTACYNDYVCVEHQLMWLEKPCCYDSAKPDVIKCNETNAPVAKFQEAKKIVDSLNICYVPFANYFMEALPKVGHWLMAPAWPYDPFTSALKITKDIIREHGADACGRGHGQWREREVGEEGQVAFV